jgi:hypothetical protein
LVNEYGVGRATIYDIRKNRKKIFVKNADSGPSDRQTLESGEYPEVEDSIYDRNRHSYFWGNYSRDGKIFVIK